LKKFKTIVLGEFNPEVPKYLSIYLFTTYSHIIL
jgi:hypothetical protein